MFLDKNSFSISKKLSLITSIFLHLTTSFFGLRITSNIGQSTLKRLLVNYSFHNGTTSIVFLITKIEPLTWLLSVCLQSFYQFLHYFVIQILPRFRDDNRTADIIIHIYRGVSGNSRINLWISLFELTTLFSIFKYKTNQKILLSFVSSFYVVWYLLYRYSSSRTHQIIWNYIYFLFVSLSGRVPNIIGTLILKACLIFSNFGTKCSLIYQLSHHSDSEIAGDIQLSV